MRWGKGSQEKMKGRRGRVNVLKIWAFFYHFMALINFHWNRKKRLIFVLKYQKALIWTRKVISDFSVILLHNKWRIPFLFVILKGGNDKYVVRLVMIFTGMYVITYFFQKFVELFQNSKFKSDRLRLYLRPYINTNLFQPYLHHWNFQHP